MPHPSAPPRLYGPRRQPRRVIQLSKLCIFQLLVFILAAHTAGAQTFAPPAQYNAAPQPLNALVGDFNGDGRPDVAVGASGGVAVLLSDGAGALGNSIMHAFTQRPKALTAGDFNGDGKLDLAAGSFNSQSSLKVLLGNGDGTFLPVVNYAAGSDVRSLSSGDFNGDGKLDLVTADYGLASFNVLLGNGDGTFRPRDAYSARAFLDSVAVGDINNDGKLDLAGSGSTNNGTNASLLLGNGDGTFQPATQIALGTGGVAKLTLVDINKDGKLDALGIDSFSVAVHLGNGDATFRPPVTTAYSSTGIPSTLSLSLADFNNDGQDDLLLGAQVSLLTMLGKGDGGFRAPVSLDGAGVSREAAAGDLNLDGKADIVATTPVGDKVSVFLNQTGPHAVSGVVSDEGGAPLAGMTVALSGAGVNPSSTVTAADGSYSFTGLGAGLSFTVTPSNPKYVFTPTSRTFDNLSSNVTANFTGALARYTISGFVVEFNDAPLAGVTVTLSGSASATAVTGPDGSYSFPSLLAGGSYTVTPSLPRYTFSPPSRVFDDLSSNINASFGGMLQTFTIGGTVRDTSRNVGLSGVTVVLSGSRTATATTSFDGAYSFAGLPIGGDYTVTVSQNLSGVLFTNRLLTQPLSRRFPDLGSNATANFEGTIFNAAVGSEPRDASAADFNLDGKLDLATANSPLSGEAASISVLLGKGDGTFNPESRVGTLNTSPVELVVADYNGDGRPDLALATVAREVGVMLGNGDGTFQARVSYAMNGAPASMTSGDFNADGKTDLVVAGFFNPDFFRVPPGMKVLFNKGDGTFETGPLIEFTSAPRMVRAGDFNGDGKSDLAFGNEAASVSVLLGNGNGTFGSPIDFTIGASSAPRRVALADFNGDGKLDLLAVDTAFAANNLRVLLGNGDGTLSAGATFTGTTGPLAVNDFDGDGKLDLVSYGGNSLLAFFGNGDGTFRNAPTTQTTSGSLVMGAGDFNNDGRTDVALARSRSGTTPLSPNLDVLLNVLSAPTVKFSAATYSAGEGDGAVVINVTRSGDLSQPAAVDYATSNVTASDRSDYMAALGTLRFAAGESSRSFTVLITNDALIEGAETLALGLGNPFGGTLGGSPTATLTINSDDTAPPTPATNPANDPQFFVRQHYRDFLNRDPDADGLNFWVNRATNCGNPDLLVCRINVSAAFFLSIEFQETGFLAYRTYKVAYGDTTSPNVAVPVPSVRLREFLPDSQRIGQGVQVGIGNWEQQLEANKQSYMTEFVARQRFLEAFPLSMMPAEFVDKLNQNAGGVLSQAERDQLVAELAAAPDAAQGRAAALRKVSEDADLRQRETNRAFVLMQYFGYLRRNPHDAPDRDFRGWEFWLSKLNQFNGNFVRAEMVRAFIESIEYRARFGAT